VSYAKNKRQRASFQNQYFFFIQGEIQGQIQHRRQAEISTLRGNAKGFNNYTGNPQLIHPVVTPNVNILRE
jgi:hypothetical protein